MTRKQLRQFLFSVGFTAITLMTFSLQSHTTAAASVDQPLKLLWQTGVTHDDGVPGMAFIALDDQGNSYVTSLLGFPAKKFNADGKVVGTFGNHGTGDGQFSIASGIAVDIQGNVYVADVDALHIQRFDSKGNFVLKWDAEPPKGPGAIHVDSKGNVYVIYFTAGDKVHDHDFVQKFDSDGKLVVGWEPTGFTGLPGFGVPNPIALDKQDNVYILDPLSHRILKFDPDDKLLGQVAVSGTIGVGLSLAVDAQGNIYLNDGNSLQKMDPDGKLLAEWSTIAQPGNDLDKAGDIAVDSQGNLYVIASADVDSMIGGKVHIPVLKKFKLP